MGGDIGWIFESGRKGLVVEGERLFFEKNLRYGRKGLKSKEQADGRLCEEEGREF